MKEIPKQTEFISISKKYIIDPNILNGNEENLCVMLTCLEHGGIPLGTYNPCYVSVGDVRKWISDHKYKKHRVFLNSNSNTESSFASPVKEY